MSFGMTSSLVMRLFGDFWSSVFFLKLVLINSESFGR